MTEAYLLLGTNQRNLTENLQSAIRLIEFRCGKILQTSNIYESEAWGLKEQPSFLNQAICIKTRFAPNDLLTTLKLIEREAGRQETVKWGPRIIDIDILFFGQLVIEEKDLSIPHPHLHERKFTLVPLAEIAPAFMHPKLNLSVADLLKNCADTGQVSHFRRGI
jgi:2-amino-4-hydroxy-6-hydroxymethyldihydropteridine diphosphokinase